MRTLLFVLLFLWFIAALYFGYTAYHNLPWIIITEEPRKPWELTPEEFRKINVIESSCVVFLNKANGQTDNKVIQQAREKYIRSRCNCNAHYADQKLSPLDYNIMSLWYLKKAGYNVNTPKTPEDYKAEHDLNFALMQYMQRHPAEWQAYEESGASQRSYSEAEFMQIGRRIQAIEKLCIKNIER